MTDVLSGALGGVVFGVLYLALNIPLPFAVAGAGAAYIAGRFITTKTRDHSVGVNWNDDAGSSQEMITEGERQVKILKELADAVPKPDVRSKFQHLAQLAEKIVAGLKENPKDAKRVRQFLNYYLGATSAILQRYTELTSRQVNSSEATAALQKVEAMLDPIEHVFEQQLAAAAQDDILDLDTELKLLEQTLQLEDLNRAK